MDIIKKRVGTDITVLASLKDNGVAVSWASLSDIEAYLYSDEQRVMAGRATTEIQKDPTLLKVRYKVDEAQYLGVNRLVLTCTYMGQTRTYDAPVVEFVELLEDEGTTTVEDITVDLRVEEVSTSLLDEAIAACIKATEEAKLVEAAIERAEEGREEAEQQRAESDSERDAAEAAREEAEQQRVENESVRVTDEKSRQSAEAKRVKAETARATAEQERLSKEAGRQSAEQQRETNETTRQSDEAGRQAAEQERQANEQQRQVTAETVESILQYLHEKPDGYHFTRPVILEAGADLWGNPLANVPEPAEAGDAVNKAYVDSLIITTLNTAI